MTTPDFDWMHERVGSVDNPSYIITPEEPMAGTMNFAERVVNTLAYLVRRYKHKVGNKQHSGAARQRSQSRRTRIICAHVSCTKFRLSK